jgi:hypothetical protein
MQAQILTSDRMVEGRRKLVMNNKLIITSRSEVLDILRRGLCRSIPEENCFLARTKMNIGDLVGLTWKMDPVVEFLSGENISRLACEMLFIGDRFSHLYGDCVARCQVKRPRLQAFPGDVFVVLPGIYHANEARASLRSQKVKVITVGTMDDSFRQVYGHHDWTSYVAPMPNDITALVK